MSEIPDLKIEVEKYRLILKEKLDSSTGEDWIVETEIELWNFEYISKLEDFMRITRNYCMGDLMHEDKILKSIGDEAYLAAFHFAREKERA